MAHSERPGPAAEAVGPDSSRRATPSGSFDDRPDRCRPRPRAIGRRPLVAALLVGLLVGIWDARRAPAEQWAARGLLLAIDGYQATLSRQLPKLGVRCRFEPTCSVYGEAVIRHFGAWRGAARVARRIARCGPWTELGTVDPPPSP